MLGDKTLTKKKKKKKKKKACTTDPKSITGSIRDWEKEMLRTICPNVSKVTR